MISRIFGPSKVGTKFTKLQASESVSQRPESTKPSAGAQNYDSHVVQRTHCLRTHCVKNRRGSAAGGVPSIIAIGNKNRRVPWIGGGKFLFVLCVGKGLQRRNRSSICRSSSTAAFADDAIKAGAAAMAHDGAGAAAAAAAAAADNAAASVKEAAAAPAAAAGDAAAHALALLFSTFGRVPEPLLHH